MAISPGRPRTSACRASGPRIAEAAAGQNEEECRSPPRPGAADVIRRGPEAEGRSAARRTRAVASPGRSPSVPRDSTHPDFRESRGGRRGVSGGVASDPPGGVEPPYAMPRRQASARMRHGDRGRGHGEPEFQSARCRARGAVRCVPENSPLVVPRPPKALDADNPFRLCGVAHAISTAGEGLNPPRRHSSLCEALGVEGSGDFSDHRGRCPTATGGWCSRRSPSYESDPRSRHDRPTASTWRGSKESRDAHLPAGPDFAPRAGEKGAARPLPAASDRADCPPC